MRTLFNFCMRKVGACLNKKEIEVIKENGGDISELVRNSEHLC